MQDPTGCLVSQDLWATQATLDHLANTASLEPQEHLDYPGTKDSLDCQVRGDKRVQQVVLGVLDPLVEQEHQELLEELGLQDRRGRKGLRELQDLLVR